MHDVLLVWLVDRLDRLVWLVWHVLLVQRIKHDVALYLVPRNGRLF
jgi:hypothetical protein